MLTLKEMRKTANEKCFKFDVLFIGWAFGQRYYSLRTSEKEYQCISYNKLYVIFNNILDNIITFERKEQKQCLHTKEIE